jgi:hypothetical protein
MSDLLTKPCTVFDGTRRLASGPLAAVAAHFKKAVEKSGDGVFLFDDTTGRAFDIDIRGTADEVVARLKRSAPKPDEDRGPGRPKLGVVAREITLLPQQWDWLSSQPGGASVTLRKLVDEARRGPKARARAARDAAYHFMSAIAGDRAGFEEATRALVADDRGRLATLIAGWPKDIREHITRLAFGEARSGEVK